MVGIGIVGYGYWGPNLVRNFLETKGVKIEGVCDFDPKKLLSLKTRYPQLKTTRVYEDFLNNPKIDAIAIATPVATHAALALKALKAGKHILVEKPLADSSKNAEKIFSEAHKRKKVLLVDHTFVYMGAVKKIGQLIKQGVIGKPLYFDSVRINLGLYQSDVNVVWDLGVHDLSIITYLFPEQPIAVSCVGMKHVSGLPEDIAYLTLFYRNNFIAHIHVNWLSPVKVRKTLISGDKKMIVWDDLEADEKVRVYDRGISRDKELFGSFSLPIGYRRMGDVWLPEVDITEALKIETVHFIRCIEGNEKPITGGEQAIKIIKIMEAANKSIIMKGKPVKLL